MLSNCYIGFLSDCFLPIDKRIYVLFDKVHHVIWVFNFIECDLYHTYIRMPIVIVFYFLVEWLLCHCSPDGGACLLRGDVIIL